MITDMTGLEFSNASLLDEGTSAAEAMQLAHSVHRSKRGKYFVSEGVHPHTIDLIESKVVEIHMTNIYAREDFRKKSLISEKCYAIFCGLGINTYRAALYSISL